MSHDFLTTAEVMDRYRLRDPRAARAIMRRAGCVKRGTGLIVQLASLDALDKQELIVDAVQSSIKAPPVRSPRQHRSIKTDTPTKLEPDWWRDAG
jgi:hypothetical protein